MKRAGSRSPSAVPAPRQKPLVTTRFRPPTPRGTLIQRPHLLQTLRETLSRKLALVYGPAGFGKTTLVTQWFAELRSAGTSAAWLQIDASDNDLSRFLLYLVEAMRSAEPDMGEGLRDLIEANPDSASEFMIDTLVNDLSVHDDDFVLFFNAHDQAVTFMLPQRLGIRGCTVVVDTSQDVMQEREHREPHYEVPAMSLALLRCVLA